MRKVTAPGKFGRLFMTAVMTCTLCVPTQALAAQDASGGASASSASSASEGENASPASSASEGGSSAVAASGVENVSLAAAEGDSSTGASGNIVDWTEDGTCQWMIDADGNLTVKPTDGAKGTLAYASPWSDYRDKIKTATFKPGVVATTASGMFEDCANMTSVDLSGLDTSGVSAMDKMFYGCSSLESLDLSQLDTSKVTDMQSMFSDCSSLVTLDLSSLNTSSATDMYALFNGCTSLTSINLSGLDASAVWDMNIMFKGCTSLASLNLSGFKTSGAQAMREMFCGCSSLTYLDLSSFSTSNVTRMNGMFEGCTKLETISGLSRFDTAKVYTIGEMFSGCSSLKSVDVTSFDTSNVNDMMHVFYGCSSLTSLDLSSFNTSKATGMDKMFDGCDALRMVTLGANFNFAGAVDRNMCSLPTPSGDDLTGNWVSSVDGTVYAPASVPSNVAATYTAEVTPIVDWTENGGCMWRIDADGNLTVKPKDGTTTGTLADACPWSSYVSSIKTATFKSGVVASSSTASMFKNCENMTSVDLSGLDTSAVTNMAGMFAYCRALTDLNLADLNTSSVTSMKEMFYACGSLTSLSLSGLDVSEVTDMGDTFAYCRALADLNLSGLDTSSLTNTYGLFSSCESLTSLDLSFLKNARSTNTGSMFANCSALTSLDLRSFNTDNVELMSGMFEGCSSLTSVDVSSFNTSKVQDANQMFRECSSLTSLDLSNFDTSSETNMYCMFYNCSSLTELNLSNFNTTKVYGMESMFAGCTSLASLDISSFDTSGVSKMDNMFADSSALRTVKLGDKFSFKSSISSSQCALPTPSGGWLTGKWVSSVDGKAYDAADVPSNVAATYTAEKDEVPVPTAVEDLTYTGKAQTGVIANPYGCKLYGDVTKTDAGSYSATAVLEDGYTWADGTTADKQFTWSIAKAVATVPAANMGLTYTGEAQTGVSAGVGYSLLGSTATNAGSHTAFAVLDGNHIWNDGSTDAKTIAWTIGKAKVTAPVAKVGLRYTGDEQIGVAADSLGLYTIEDGAQTAAGDHTATAKLVDPENHAWADGTTADKQIAWSIAKAVVTAPAAVAGLTYTGAEQTGVAAGEGYSLFGMPAATDAGTYTALAVLDGNHIWNDGLATPKTIMWTMGKAKVTAPVANTGLTYTGSEQAGVPTGDGYVLSGAATATDAGSYTAIATPDGNHTWSDGTADAKAIAWSITKGVPSYEVPAGLTASYGQTLANVALPEGFSWQDDASTSVGVAGEHTFLATYTPADTANYEPVRDIAVTVTVDPAKVTAPTAVTGLVYNGKAQTGVAADSMGLYTVEGGAQTAAGDYTATAKLIDPANHTWADGTTADKQIAWSIAKAATEGPSAKTGLAYTGAEQVGVPAGDGYVLSGAATATDAGSYVAIVTPDGNHTWADGTSDAKAIAWSIAKAAVAAPAAATGLTYNGKEQTGVVAGDGYSLYGSAAATDAGTYTALAVLDGNHIWSDGSVAPKTLSWVIGKAKVEAPAANKGVTYTGAEQAGVAAGDGYVLSGAATATDAGSYTAIVTPDGNHTWADGTSDAKAIAWSIAKADISAGKAEIESASFVYMGRAIKPAVTVTVGGKTLTPGVDYVVAYSDNDAIGTAEATVTGMDNYDGALTVDFAIVSKVVDVFSDANYGDWYVDFGVLDYAYAHGLVSGYSGTDLVGAYDFITRQDVAVILWRMAGEPEVTGGIDFADVDYGDYYGPAVRWARATGVINGYQDADGAYRNFGPSDLVTREQLAVMIANYAGKVGGLTIESDCFNLNALPDAASVSDWARTSFGWCVDMGIIGGVQDTVSGVSYAQPGNNAWRISMVSMTAVLHRDVLKLG